MKHNELLPLARLASFLSLFGILLCMHITFSMAHFLPSGSNGVMYAVYIFYFTGIAIGVVLCPLFLPVPCGKNKSLFMSIGFIAFLIALEFILRSFGFDVWLDSAAVRSIMAIPEGILTTMSHGLFYLTWLHKSTADGKVNRTGKFCSLVFGVILLCSVLISYYSVPLINSSIAAIDPLKGAILIFNFIKWCMVVMAVSASVCVFLMKNLMRTSALSDNSVPVPPDSSVSMPLNSGVSAVVAVKTDWQVILRLIGMASVFTILNGVMDMRALPLYTDKAVYYPYYLIVAAVVPAFGFLAGLSIKRFIRRFLLPVLILFILFSCLPLFEDNPQFNVIMSTLISIAHYTAWIVFTTAIVELYSGGFWFYGASTVIFFTVVFAFLSPLISPLVPHGREYQVLFIIIAIVFAMLMAFRWLLFPKLPRYATAKRQSAAQPQEPFSASNYETSNIENTFRERGLSKREIQIANLLVKEGLEKKEIGKRLFIAPGTVKIHISKIYQKFDVDNRAELMALFVKSEKV